jgi:hypothetical protein
MQRNRRQSHEGQVRLAGAPTFLRRLNSYQKVQVLVCTAAYIYISLIQRKITLIMVIRGATSFHSGSASHPALCNYKVFARQRAAFTNL